MAENEEYVLREGAKNPYWVENSFKEISGAVAGLTQVIKEQNEQLVRVSEAISQMYEHLGHLTAAQVENMERQERKVEDLVKGAVVNVIDAPEEPPEKNRYGR